MKVFVVGSGCTWFQRNNTSFILDDKILFDTPSGSYKDVIKNIDIFKLDAIIISHFHADHFGDFPVFATRFMRESVAMGRNQKLKVYGPKSVLEKLISLNTLLGGAKDECDKEMLQKHIDFIDVGDGDEFAVAGYKVKVYQVDHGHMYCQGYTFEDAKGKVIGFTGDTRECDGLLNILSQSNIAFVDMAALKPVPAHLDVKRFMELQKKYPKCKMYPVHMSDETKKFAEENSLDVLNDFDEIII